MTTIYCLQDSKGVTIGCFTTEAEAYANCNEVKRKQANKNLLAVHNVPDALLQDQWSFLFIHYNNIFGITDQQIDTECAGLTCHSIVEKTIT